MIVDPIVKPSQPEWRQPIDRQLGPNAPVSKAPSFDQASDDSDPDLQLGGHTTVAKGLPIL